MASSATSNSRLRTTRLKAVAGAFTSAKSKSEVLLAPGRNGEAVQEAVQTQSPRAHLEVKDVLHETKKQGQTTFFSTTPPPPAAPLLGEEGKETWSVPVFRVIRKAPPPSRWSWAGSSSGGSCGRPAPARRA